MLSDIIQHGKYSLEEIKPDVTVSGMELRWTKDPSNFNQSKRITC